MVQGPSSTSHYPMLRHWCNGVYDRRIYVWQAPNARSFCSTRFMCERHRLRDFDVWFSFWCALFWVSTLLAIRCLAVRFVTVTSLLMNELQLFPRSSRVIHLRWNPAGMAPQQLSSIWQTSCCEWDATYSWKCSGDNGTFHIVSPPIHINATNKSASR